MKKGIALWITLTLALTLLVGCGKQSKPAEGESSTQSTAEPMVSGHVTLAGSTSMEDLVKLVSETLPETYPEVTLQGEFVGSSAGIEQLLAGNCDIGNASRGLKEKEKEAGAVENVVCYDGIAIVKNPANVLGNLTTEQLTAIYKGEITNWSEVGGSDMDIVVVGREAGSGTRGAFEELLDVEDACKLAQELDSNGAVITTVSATEGAIGYASLNIAEANEDKVDMMQFNGVDASAETIQSGEYALFRPFVMATKGELSEQSETVQAVFEYLKSDAGIADITSLGLIAAD